MNTFFDYDGTFVFDELEQLVGVVSTVDVGEFEEESQVSAYPNPIASDGLTVKASDQYSEWQVFNTLGVCTAQGAWTGPQQWFETHDWPKGVCVLILTGPTARTAIPLLKR